MIGVNPLRTKVLITTDEVIFHAPVDHDTDPRTILQSIIIAERRFVKPLVGATVYNALIDNKNALVTPGNKSILQEAVNTGREGDREIIKLYSGDYVNSDTYLNSVQQELWHQCLHKIVAECVWFCSLPVNRARFTAKGVVKNYPESISSTQDSVTIDLSELKHLMDRGLRDRINPLIDDMHEYMCLSGYPGYIRSCEGCGRSYGSGTPRSNVVLGMYDDDPRPSREATVYVSSVYPTQNETIPFEDVSKVIIPWNTNRKRQFGAGGIFKVEILDEEDGQYHEMNISVVPDDIYLTTLYTIDLGGTATGRVIIG